MSKPKMTRQHFQFIANLIKGLEGDSLRVMVAYEFAYELSGTNEYFDRSRFLAACGVDLKD